MRKISDRATQLLFVDWMRKLCSDRLGVKSSGFSTDPEGQRSWNFTLQDDTKLKIKFTGKKSIIQSECDKIQRRTVTEIEREAYRLATNRNYGEGSWWKCAFSTDVELNAFMGLHFMRSLGEHKRYHGYWRIGGEALFYFVHENIENTTVIVPKFTVTITFKVPAPGHGPFGENLAGQYGTFLRALATFVSGTPLKQGGMLFPVKVEEVTNAVNEMNSDEVRELFVDDVVLWPQLVSLVSDPDEAEALRRVQGAIYSYEQALRQESEYVATVLFVSAIEALAVPNADWRRLKLTKRFVEFVMATCPEAVAGTMLNANFGQAFGPIVSPRSFLEGLYDRRSRPLHTGRTPHFLSSPASVTDVSTMRISLISRLTREVILSFLRAPFCSLVGHPSFEPDDSQS